MSAHCYLSPYAAPLQPQPQPQYQPPLPISSILVPRQTSLNADGSSMKRPNYIGYRKHLATTSLIDVDRDSQSVRVHRVVQNVMIEMLLRDGTSASVFKEAILRVADQWPILNRNYVTGSATKVDRWVQCGRVYHHLLRLKEVYVQLNKLQISHLAAFDLAELLLEAAQYRLECGIGHEAIPLLELAEVIYGLDQLDSPCLEEERGKFYKARIGLAISSKNTEDLLNYAQLGWEVEEKRHRKIGHPTSILAVAYNDLAVAWACYGEWEKGIELLKKSTSVREHLLGFTRDKLFSPLYHLGLILQHQTKYDEAENILNGAIKDREESLGTSEASISVRSAALYYARGNVRFLRADPLRKDIEKSLLDHMEAVSRCRQSVGSKNRTTLICKYQVTKVSAELRNFKKSCELLDEILCNTIEAVTYYPDIARTAYLYAHCLDALGNTTESNRWLLKSLDIHNKLRSQHIRTTGTLTKDDITRLIPYDYL